MKLQLFRNTINRYAHQGNMLESMKLSHSCCSFI